MKQLNKSLDKVVSQFSGVNKSANNTENKVKKSSNNLAQSIDNLTSKLRKSVESLNGSIGKTMKSAEKQYSKASESMRKFYQEPDKIKVRFPAQYRAELKEVEAELVQAEFRAEEFKDAILSMTTSKSQIPFSATEAITEGAIQAQIELDELRQRKLELDATLGIAGGARYGTQALEDMKLRAQELQEEIKQTEINLKTFVTTAPDGYHELVGEIEKTKEAIELMMKAGVKSDDSGLVNLKIKLTELDQKFEEMTTNNKEFADPKIYEQYLVKLSELTREYNSLRDAIQKTSDSMNQFNDNAPHKTFKDLTGSIRPLKDLFYNFKIDWQDVLRSKDLPVDAAEIKGQIQSIADNITVKLAQAWEHPVLALGQMGQGLAAVAVATGKVLSTMGKVAVRVGQIGSGLWNWMKSISPVHLTIQNIQEKMNVLFGRLKRLVEMKILRSALTKTVEILKKYIGANSAVESSLATMRGAWLTAFQPVVESVIPICVRLLNILTQLGYKFAYFTSMLTGRTIKATQGLAKNMYDTAEATASAGAEAQKTLAPFDELNRLDANSAGGGAIDAMKDVDFGDIEGEVSKYKTWGEAYSAILDKIASYGDKFNSFLESSAGKINYFFQHLTEMFNYIDENGIPVIDKIGNIGKDLAQKLNNFISQIDFVSIGTGLAGGINHIFRFMTEFIYNFDWLALGRSIATSINSLFQNVDFEQIGKWVIGKFNALFETIKGFVETLNWEVIGESIRNFFNGMIENFDAASLGDAINGLVNGILTMLLKALDGLKVTELGQKLAQLFNRINWKDTIQKIGNLLTKAIKGAFDLLLAFLKDFDFYAFAEGLFAGLLKAIVDINWLDVFASILEAVGVLCADIVQLGIGLVVGLLDGILYAMKDIWNWINTNVVQPILNAVKGLFGIHSPSTVFADIGRNLIAGLLNGITEFWTNITNFFSQKLPNLKTQLDTGWTNIKTSAKTIFNNMKTDISTVFDNLSSSIQSKISTLKSKLSGLKDKVSDTFNSVGYSYKGINSIYTPHLASGGVINSPTVALLGEYAGASHNPEIATPQSLLESIVSKNDKEMISALSSGFSKVVNAVESKDFEISIGDETIAKSADKGNKLYEMRTGKPLFAY